MFGILSSAATTREVSATPEQVWDVLADGRRYADWVVGASHIRDVESDWPAVGARFHHTVGVWPLHLRDDTVVEQCDNGKRLVLEARARPFGRARVEIAIEQIPTGTRIVLSEGVRSPSLARWSNPLFAPLIHVRNTEALRRLAVLCEEPMGAVPRHASEPGAPEDGLDKELADSFPASDPPSSWGGIT